MTNGWQVYRIGDLLTQNSDNVKVAPDKSYKLLGISLEGRGAFLREEKTGDSISATTLSPVHAGDFIYSRLFAWRGAFDIVPEELDSCFVSGEFPTFKIHTEILLPKFLRLYFNRKVVWEEVEKYCTGTTKASRNRFKEQFFLDMEIPLPPLTEQRRIVERVEALTARIAKAQSLREEADEELNTLLISMAHRSDATNEKLLEEGWIEVRLGEVIHQVRDRVRVEPNTHYPNLGIYSFARGLFHKQPIDGNLTSAKELCRVHKGQFIYSRLFAFEGACGFITDEYDGCYVSGEYPTFDCDPEKVKPEFLYAYFKSLGIWKEISSGSKGLGDRRQRVQPEKFLEHKLLLPPLEWQSRIATVMQKVDHLRGLQSETEEELNALLPSILDRAFVGKPI